MHASIIADPFGEVIDGPFDTKPPPERPLIALTGRMQSPIG